MEGPSAPPAESPGRDKYRCPVCQAEFAYEHSQRRHVRKQHPEAASSLVSSAKAFYSCDQCSDVFARRGQLLQHHEQNHGFVSRRSTLQFSSYSDFAAWKEMEEMKEQVRFVASSGPKRSSSGVTQMYLLCYRSGMHVKTGAGKRQPKSVGSVKCNKHCFATMAVTQEGENVTVEYQAEHYGHEKSVKHRRLTSTMKNAIAAQLSLGVPVKRILVDFGDETNVLHTLNRHDVYNIKRKFCIGNSEDEVLPSTSPGSSSFPLDEPQALPVSIQADSLPEPQSSNMEGVRTLAAALLQDLLNKEDSADTSVVELLEKKLLEARQVAKQFPDKQPSLLKSTASNKSLEKQPD
ncbi:uncharacterized protein LOC144108329 [Amblyomma americanum]